ncbi:MAG: radical SAM protein [Bacteroidales bacterium]|nr:radical SAM protein [Bacteroidales bacterium]
MTDLSAYMSESIRNIMGHAYLNVLSNPHEARFVARMQKVFIRSERRRKQVLKDDGLEVPPFLIASIATACNLQCKGCYARKNGIANDPGALQKTTLSPLQWQTIFKDASALGVNFCLLAGGEPLTRRDLLETIATVDDIIFPVFTNATLIGPQYIEFFRRHLNIVPIVSLEGDAAATDDRRGKGVYQRALLSMEMLHKEHLFFGTSITVTTENYLAVTSKEYLMQLAAMGCRLVFFVEYVPFDESTQHLAFNDEHVAQMEQLLEQCREEVKEMIFLSFPGDEKALDGCLAAGRGFFHIGPDGAAEPCPFSPFSDSNVAQMGLREALKSPLFSKIRAAKALGWEHTGGCTLFEHRAEVEAMLKEGK